MSEEKKGEQQALRDKAVQRRLKQATQFSHKDSADLLPLDGLKRLGTSKDLQPHNIVQRRLLEGNITRLRGEARDMRVRSPLADNKDGGEAEERVEAEERGGSESTADDSASERESLEESERSLRSDDEDDSSDAARHKNTGPPLAAPLSVTAKCCESEVQASINTSSRHNLISSACCRRLGLVASQVDGSPCAVSSSSSSSSSLVSPLQLQLGSQTLQTSAYVTEDEVFDLSLGLQTLLDLKCCLDLNRRVLKLEGGAEELPFVPPRPVHSQCQRDSNQNL